MCASPTRELQPSLVGDDMSPGTEEAHEELRPEYDFDYSKAVRGKYYKRLIEEGASVIVLAPDLAEPSRDSVAADEVERKRRRRRTER